MTKRYLVFAYGNYYPTGGWSDLYAQCDTLEEARAARMRAFSDGNDCVDVIDLFTGADVGEEGSEYFIMADESAQHMRAWAKDHNMSVEDMFRSAEFVRELFRVAYKGD